MKIINNQNYLKNKQLLSIINHLNSCYKPKTLVIYETRLDLIRFLFKNINIVIRIYLLLNVFVWLGKREGIYFLELDMVVIFVFSENDDGDDKQSKQLYSLHALLHELRHRWQCKTNFKKDKEKDADKFATHFVNTKSELISNIMGWQDEWEMEE